MCIIVPVSHIPCAHTSSIWQYCGDASTFGAGDTRSCWNVRLEKNGKLSSQRCEDCENINLLGTRDGIGEKAIHNLRVVTQSTKPEGDDEDGNDSGYHSDIIHEEKELPDIDERPLSPRTMSPRHSRQSKRTSSRQRMMARKLSWKPNLYPDPACDNIRAPCVRRESIDSILSSSDCKNWPSSGYQMIDAVEVGSSNARISQGRPSTIDTRYRRGSTLLHPSSPPPMETTANAQVAKAYNFPQVVDVQKALPPVRPKHARKKSTLLHPSSPIDDTPLEQRFFSHGNPEAQRPRHRPAAPVRKLSSLLHPSSPPDATTLGASHKTVLRVPPVRASCSTDARNRSTTSRSRRGSRQSSRARLMPAPQINSTERPALDGALDPDHLATSATYRRRQYSILHSSLSDSEEPATMDDPMDRDNNGVMFSLDMFGKPNCRRREALRDVNYGNACEDVIMRTAVVARQNREMGRFRH